MPKTIPPLPLKPIAAFDFDGTLTFKDSFISFLLYKFGVYRIVLTFLSKPRLLLNYIVTRDRGVLKSHLLYALFGNISKTDLQKQMADFADAHKDTIFRPDALITWENHASLGHTRVIVTASPDILVAHFGDIIGADLVIGTRLGFDANDRLLPDLDGVNCRCEEKVRRLKLAFGDNMILHSAYGDTKGDFDMIKAAQNGHYRVFKEKPNTKN